MDYMGLAVFCQYNNPIINTQQASFKGPIMTKNIF